MPLGFDPVGSSALTETQTSSVATELSVLATGVSATGSVGAVTARPATVVRPGGLSGSALVGVVGVGISGTVTVEGVTATAVLGQFGISHNGAVSTTPVGVSCRGNVGAVVAVTTAIPGSAAIGSLVATGEIGDITVVGAKSVVPVQLEGVSAFALLGEAIIKQSAFVELEGLEGTMPTDFSIYAMVSSFGGDILQVAPSQWTPVKPA